MIGKHLWFPKMELCFQMKIWQNALVQLPVPFTACFLSNSDAVLQTSPWLCSSIRCPGTMLLPFHSSWLSADAVMPLVHLWGIFLSALHPHYSCHLVRFCFASIQQMCSHLPSHSDLNDLWKISMPMSLHRYRDRQWGNAKVLAHIKAKTICVCSKQGHLGLSSSTDSMYLFSFEFPNSTWKRNHLWLPKMLQDPNLYFKKQKSPKYCSSNSCITFNAHGIQVFSCTKFTVTYYWWCFTQAYLWYTNWITHS